MRTSAFRWSAIVVLFAIALLSCNWAARLASSTPRAVPSATATLEPLAVVTVPGKSGEYYGAVKIVGNPDFVIQTRMALALLEAKSPEAYRKIQTYVGIIEQGQHSGMWAWEDPPRYEVGDPTAFSSVTWYASTIAHDATHSELYHNGQEWDSIAAEQFCNAFELSVLKQIGAPQSEIDYMASQNGDHCDVDHDGDCDWTDYENRNW